MTVTTALARTQVVAQQMGALVSSKDPDVQNYYDLSLGAFASSDNYALEINHDQALPTMLADKRTLEADIANWESKSLPTRFDTFKAALATSEVKNGMTVGAATGLVGGAYGAVCAAIGGAIGGAFGAACGGAFGMFFCGDDYLGVGENISGSAGVIAGAGSAVSMIYGVSSGNIPLAVAGVVTSLGVCMGVSVGLPLILQYSKLRGQVLNQEREILTNISLANASLSKIKDTIESHFTNEVVQKRLASDPKLALRFMDDHVLPLVAGRIEQIKLKRLEAIDEIKRIGALINEEKGDHLTNKQEKQMFLREAGNIKTEFGNEVRRLEGLIEALEKIQEKLRGDRDQVYKIQKRQERLQQGAIQRRRLLVGYSKKVDSYDRLVQDVVEEMMGILNGTQTLLIEMKALVLTDEEMLEIEGSQS